MSTEFIPFILFQKLAVLKNRKIPWKFFPILQNGKKFPWEKFPTGKYKY